MGFNGGWNGTANAVPASFSINGTTWDVYQAKLHHASAARRNCL
jgi:hypothetical protein